jgi:hypothetical protein
MQHSSAPHQPKINTICRWAKNIDDVTAISALANVKVGICFLCTATPHITYVAGHFAVPQQHHFFAPVCRLYLAQVIRMLLGIPIHILGVNIIALRELFLRKNNICDIQELRWLSGLQNLHVLWLAENPVTATLNCGLTIDLYKRSLVNIILEMFQDTLCFDATSLVLLISDTQSFYRSSKRAQVPAGSSQA